MWTWTRTYTTRFDQAPGPSLPVSCSCSSPCFTGLITISYIACIYTVWHGYGSWHITLGSYIRSSSNKLPVFSFSGLHVTSSRASFWFSASELPSFWFLCIGKVKINLGFVHDDDDGLGSVRIVQQCVHGDPRAENEWKCVYMDRFAGTWDLGLVGRIWICAYMECSSWFLGECRTLSSYISYNLLTTLRYSFPLQHQVQPRLRCPAKSILMFVFPLQKHHFRPYLHDLDLHPLRGFQHHQYHV